MNEPTPSTAITLYQQTPEDRARELLFKDNKNVARRAFGIGNTITYTGLTLAPFAAKVFGVLPDYHLGLVAIASIALGTAGGVARNSSLGTVAKIFEIFLRYNATIDKGVPTERLKEDMEQEFNNVP